MARRGNLGGRSDRTAAQGIGVANALKAAHALGLLGLLLDGSLRRVSVLPVSFHAGKDLEEKSRPGRTAAWRTSIL